eukprot:scaffold19123_cov21-Tisochrysis_lutea.AAC.3
MCNEAHMTRASAQLKGRGMQRQATLAIQGLPTMHGRMRTGKRWVGLLMARAVLDTYFNRDHQRKMRTLRSQKDKADAAAALEEAIEAKEDAAAELWRGPSRPKRMLLQKCVQTYMGLRACMCCSPDENIGAREDAPADVRACVHWPQRSGSAIPALLAAPSKSTFADGSMCTCCLESCLSFGFRT